MHILLLGTHIRTGTAETHGADNSRFPTLMKMTLSGAWKPPLLCSCQHWLSLLTQSPGCMMASCCGLTLYFPDDWWGSAPSPMFTDHLWSTSSSLSLIFLLDLSVFFLLTCRASQNILIISLCWPISHSMTWLFSHLIVSFDKQKFFSCNPTCPPFTLYKVSAFGVLFTYYQCGQVN